MYSCTPLTDDIVYYNVKIRETILKLDGLQKRLLIENKNMIETIGLFEKCVINYLLQIAIILICQTKFD